MVTFLLGDNRQRSKKHFGSLIDFIIKEKDSGVAEDVYKS